MRKVTPSPVLSRNGREEGSVSPHRAQPGGPRGHSQPSLRRAAVLPRPGATRCRSRFVVVFALCSDLLSISDQHFMDAVNVVLCCHLLLLEEVVSLACVVTTHAFWYSHPLAPSSGFPIIYLVKIFLNFEWHIMVVRCQPPPPPVEVGQRQDSAFC